MLKHTKNALYQYRYVLKFTNAYPPLVGYTLRLLDILQRTVTKISTQTITGSRVENWI